MSNPTADQSNTLAMTTRQCPVDTAISEAILIVKNQGYGFCVIRWGGYMYAHVTAHNVYHKKEKKVYRAVRFKLKGSIISQINLQSLFDMFDGEATLEYVA